MLKIECKKSIKLWCRSLKVINVSCKLSQDAILNLFDYFDGKRFVAFMNYYRRFIPNFAEIAQPLSNLTRKRIEFDWDEKCNNAFNSLKNSILNPQILKYPDFEKKFTLTVDASQYACGGVLTQKHNDFDHPVKFISKTFKKGEINKPTIEKELLAIHYAITQFRPYLYGKIFHCKIRSQASNLPL